MPLRRICEGLFAVETNLALTGVSLPVRSTIVSWGDGTLLVHSPVAFSDADVKSMDALGTVHSMVAPSGLHYRYAVAAQQCWPNAEVWAPKVVQRKSPALRISHCFEEGRWPHAAELPVFPLDGAPNVAEHVFFHRATRTLIVVDLVFNILAPTGVLAWPIFKLFGTYRHFDASRLYRRFIQDRPAFALSLEPILALPFSRLVMAHGEVMEGEDLPQRLRDATRRLCH